MGNLDVIRDWGWAPDYVNAMRLILNASSPSDFVVATGRGHSVRDLVSTAFKVVGIDAWEKYVDLDPNLQRPNDIFNSIGDSTKVRQELNWKPEVNFSQMTQIMVEHDLKLLHTSSSSNTSSHIDVWKEPLFSSKQHLKGLQIFQKNTVSCKFRLSGIHITLTQ